MAENVPPCRQQCTTYYTHYTQIQTTGYTSELVGSDDPLESAIIVAQW